MTDWAQLYRDNLDALVAVADDLSADELTRTVPATPAWSVRQVYAHLAGGAADAVSGRMDGAPGPAWTTRHVAERDDEDITDLLAELRTNADAIARSTADNPRPALVWDIAVHHTDLREALQLAPAAESLWRPVLDAVTAMRLEGVDTSGVDDYEVFRGVFSRRSRRQMGEWEIDLDADALDALCIFGPRDDDLPAP